MRTRVRYDVAVKGTVTQIFGTGSRWSTDWRTSYMRRVRTCVRLCEPRLSLSYVLVHVVLRRGGEREGGRALGYEKVVQILDGRG